MQLGPETGLQTRLNQAARRNEKLCPPSAAAIRPKRNMAARMGSPAAALLLAIGLGFQMREAARALVLVTVLLSDDNRPAAVVNTFRDGRAELVPLAALRAPEGKALQVWTLWDRARGPVSVGLVDALPSLDLQLKGLPTAVPEQLFEVTLEPSGGSPTGRPTGPILMKGTASRAL
ncbi:anti-sigma factor [Xanthobacter autotrophicus ATCC 700551]